MTSIFPSRTIDHHNTQADRVHCKRCGRYSNDEAVKFTGNKQPTRMVLRKSNATPPPEVITLGLWTATNPSGQIPRSISSPCWKVSQVSVIAKISSLLDNSFGLDSLFSVKSEITSVETVLQLETSLKIEDGKWNFYINIGIRFMFF